MSVPVVGAITTALLAFADMGAGRRTLRAAVMPAPTQDIGLMTRPARVHANRLRPRRRKAGDSDAEFV